MKFLRHRDPHDPWHKKDRVFCSDSVKISLNRGKIRATHAICCIPAKCGTVSSMLILATSN